MRAALVPFTRLLAGMAALALAVLLLAGPARAEDATPLVSTEWLAQHLRDADLVVLDVRSAISGDDEAAYARAHIPGALHSDYDKAGWRVTRNGVPFLLPSTAELEKLIGESGIDEDSRVVVVPAGTSYTDFGAAARIYWTLKVAGVTKVSILDGGFAAWTAEHRPVESGANTPTPKIFTATLDESLIAETPAVETIERNGGATLIDARPATFFAGKEKAGPARAYGHIPGAVSLDSAAFYDETTNRLKPADELRRIAGTLPGLPAVAYCNSGHWGATDWFVLSQILGRKDVRLYPGSMIEWTADPNRPLASSRTKWDDLKKKLGFGS